VHAESAGRRVASSHQRIKAPAPARFKLLARARVRARPDMMQTKHFAFHSTSLVHLFTSFRLEGCCYTRPRHRSANHSGPTGQRSRGSGAASEGSSISRGHSGHRRTKKHSRKLLEYVDFGQGASADEGRETEERGRRGKKGQNRTEQTGGRVDGQET
jgi:hypothetical protein